MTGVFRPFGDRATSARKRGFEVVPADGKVPSLKGWNGNPLGFDAVRKLAANPSYANRNLAFRTGRLLAIDIDITEHAEALRIADLAFGMLGRTPLVRIGQSPKRTLYYRLREPVTSHRVGKVDILSKNRISVVWGRHPKTGKAYYWPEECLLDVEFKEVPRVDLWRLAGFVEWLETEQANGKKVFTPEHARDGIQVPVEVSSTRRAVRSRAPQNGTIAKGERNNALFGALMRRASHVKTQAELRTRADQINSAYNPPLSKSEVDSVVASVWRYKSNGRVFVPDQQHIVLPFGKDEIRSFASKPEAMLLYAHLRAIGYSKRGFTIPQKGTAKYFGWGSNRLAAAIRVLLDRGIIRRMPSPRRHAFNEPAQYEWTN